MKISEQWLHEWVKPKQSREEICQRMTMAGLEIEAVDPVVKTFTHVVVGEVLRIEKHPEADRLTVCEVNVGASKSLTIVCGAKNVKPGMKVPTACEGAILPNGLAIKISKLRGIVSEGMLCSAVELGLAEESEGLLALPHDAKIGLAIWDYLQLEDYIIDVSITPNRGDCLSIRGMAREIAALTQTLQTPLNIVDQSSTIKDTLPVIIEAPECCSHYVGRVIRNIKRDATTPIWLKERLRRAGVRCISPVVDIMNYVMLELGQPMHAFDLSKLNQKIIVRKSKKNEKLITLDNQVISLTEDTLIIADQQSPVAIAGVMGGLDSAVTTSTCDIFIESAYFSPESVAYSVRQYNLHSDSSYRFERNVDPALQVMAAERATMLLLDIVGGEVGPITQVEKNHFSQLKKIELREVRVEKILGMKIASETIEKILISLGFICNKNAKGWEVTVPSYRPDVTIEEDLIEEIMRLYGSDKIPLRPSIAELTMRPIQETAIDFSVIRKTFVDLGYHEVVTYTFIDSKDQALLDPDHKPKPLLNPISADMDVMRTNLWPGLIKTLIYNLNRQQYRVRLYEIGLRFVPAKNNYEQERMLSGLITGAAFPEQWGVSTRSADFFDLKGDLEKVLGLGLDKIEFKPAKHPALHPGQTAEVYSAGERVGVMGALHPAVTQALGLENQQIFVFEFFIDKITTKKLPLYTEISKFPEIRRDIAIFVDCSIPAQSIQDTIERIAGELLQEVNLFDLYQGKQLGETRKSLALSLVLQHPSRTLVDEEVSELMDRVITSLKDEFAAELRG